MTPTKPLQGVTSNLQEPRIAAVDFDGTIAEYETWQGPTKIGRPIWGSRNAVRRLKNAGYRVIVFSTRANTAAGTTAIWDWLLKHGYLPYIEDVTDTKPPFTVLFDDRARHVRTNSKKALLRSVESYLRG